MNPLTQATGLVRLQIGSLLLGVLAGCAGGPAHHDASWTPVQITDAGMVAGEWEGVVIRGDDMLPSGSVRATIRENGTYLFTGQTAEKMAVGAGSLQVQNGRLVGDSDRRAVSLSLYEHKGKAILTIESTNHETGEHYHGDFTKIQ